MYEIIFKAFTEGLKNRIPKKLNFGLGDSDIETWNI